MYYHVRITQKSNKTSSETKVDLTEEQLRIRFIMPYENGDPIVINGKTVTAADIDRIQISKSDADSRQLISRLKTEDSDSSIVFLGGPSYEWRAADIATDVTDELIQGAPGYKKATPESAGYTKRGTRQVNKVFIVHGHDHSLKNDLESFLHSIGIDPVVLHRQPDEGLTIIEKFEKYSDVSYAFVLLTPDDVGFEATKLGNEDKDRGLEYRARQNVVFEFGFFIGALSRKKVCCIYRQGVELPSDLQGLVYKEVAGGIESIGYSLIRERGFN